MEALIGIDLIALIKAAGYAGLFVIIFAESGLLLGFFLPGDSLLFTAGFLASQGFLDVRILSFLMFIAAVAGDSVGYTFGKKVGPKIFYREDSLFFHKSHIEIARAFYEKHGPKTIMLARFLPMARTFAPILAGVGEMKYTKFLSYNVIGGALWALGMPWLGYFLGSSIPNIDKYLLPIIFAIIFLSITPGLYHFFRDSDIRRQLYNAATSVWRKNKNG